MASVLLEQLFKSMGKGRSAKQKIRILIKSMLEERISNVTKIAKLMSAIWHFDFIPIINFGFHGFLILSTEPVRPKNVTWVGNHNAMRWSLI